MKSFHIGVHCLRLFVACDGKRQLAARYSQTVAVKWDNGPGPVLDKQYLPGLTSESVHGLAALEN